jgi:multiple sugar transport system permease protein
MMTAQTQKQPGFDLRAKLYRLQIVKRLVMTILLLVFTFFALFPFFWMALTSLRLTTDFYKVAKTPFAITGITLEHYRYLMTEMPFLRWFGNSLLVASFASVIALLIGVLAAYSLGRLRYKGGGVAALVVFSTYLVPPVLLFIPLSYVVNLLGLANSLWALIITYLTFLVPFISWMLSGYFKSIPSELSDAARIDGASRLRAMMLIDLPLILPGVVSVFFFAFTLSWSEYLYALTFLRTESKFTVALGVVSTLQVGDVFMWGPMMGGALLGSIPVVIIYSFLMDYYLAGLTAGAIKG